MTEVPPRSILPGFSSVGSAARGAPVDFQGDELPTGHLGHLPGIGENQGEDVVGRGRRPLSVRQRWPRSHRAV